MEMNFFLGVIAGAVIVVAAFLVPAIVRFNRTAKAAEDLFRSLDASLRPLMPKLEETIERTNRVALEVEDSINNVRKVTEAVGETGAIISDMNSSIRKMQMFVSVNTSCLGIGIKTALAVLAQGLLKKEDEK